MTTITILTAVLIASGIILCLLAVWHVLASASANTAISHSAEEIAEFNNGPYWKN